MKKRLSVFILAIVAMMMSALPQTVQAQTREAYVVKNSGDKTLTFYYDTNRHVWEENTALHVYGIKDVHDDGYSPAWAGSYGHDDTDIIEAVFDTSFRDYQPTNTGFWFYYCAELKKISGMENLNTENVTDMQSMFSGCKVLQSIDLSSFNTQNVICMYGMFLNCHSLTSIDLSKFNTQNVTEMSAMFSECHSLTSIDLSGFNTQKVTHMSGAFRSCWSLKSINLSGFNPSNLKDTHGLFSGCGSLTSIDLSDLNPQSIERMEDMFYDCTSLKTIDIANLRLDYGKNIKNMFYNCMNLTTIYCNYAWSCEESTDMFSFCVKLVGAVAYDENKTEVTMANPYTGYFTKKITEGIESATADVPAKKQGTYNLQGVRMADDMSKLPKGIYIVDGEKVMKK